MTLDARTRSDLVLVVGISYWDEAWDTQRFLMTIGTVPFPPTLVNVLTLARSSMSLKGNPSVLAPFYEKDK